MQPFHEALQRLIDKHQVPSASVCVRVDGEERLHATVGSARLHPPRPAVTDQAYDLASLTKALVAAPVTARLLQDGHLALEQEVRELLPDVPAGILVRHLLNHSAGYPAHLQLHESVADAWGLARSRRTIVSMARRAVLEAAPGERHRYSDIGFLVLLDVLEVVTGERIDHFFNRRVLGPAGIVDIGWGWPGAAATEHCPVREVIVEGTVHDLNCAAMGGVSSHAGLFGTARAVARLGEAILEAARGEDNGLPGAGLRLLWSMDGPGSHCGGFDRISPGYTSTGSYFPPDTVGHLGFTGTSLWLAPSRRTAVVLLSNRVHPHADALGIRQLRPELHDLVARRLGWVQSLEEDR